MLFKGATLVCPQKVLAGDLRTDGEKIIALGQDLCPLPNEEVINLAGKLLLPGIIDSHTHFLLRARAAVTADDVYSGSVSALLGGVTTVIDYANQLPAAPLLAGIEARRQEFAPAVVDYNLHLVINDYYQPGMATEFPRLRRAGITSVKLFTTYKDAGYMLPTVKWQSILEGCHQAGLVVTVHAEADEVVAAATARGMAAGQVSPADHPDLRPDAAEVTAVAALIELSQNTGCPVYVVHLSTGAAWELLRAARSQGVPMLVETTPHYLLLDRELLSRPDGANFLMTPPLRVAGDREALWRGVADGSIDVVATDHCAFTPAQKAQGDSALNILPGIPGVETLLPLMYTYGVAAGRISLNRMAELLAANPARIFGLTNKGRLEVGADADLVIYDPQPKTQLQDSQVHSLAGYSAFSGLDICGRVEMTVLRGQVVARDGHFLGSRGQGKFIFGN